MLERQRQEVEGGAVGIQGGRDVVVINNTGLTYSDVRTIALDVYRANLLELKGAAADIARARGEEITDKFLQKLQTENPEGLNQAETPDFQDALFTVQKEHAKAGDSDLGDLLVDLLVDRTKQPNRNILQLVLNESIHTAPKLTSGQIAAGSLIFLFRYVQFLAENRQNLFDLLDEHVRPVAEDFAISVGTFNHLEFTGCGSHIPYTNGDLELALLTNYAGVFQKGFSDDVLNAKQLLPEAVSLVIPCLTDFSVKQVRTLNAQTLKNAVVQNGMSEDSRVKLEQLLLDGRLDGPEVRKKTIESAPYMEKVFSAWNETGLGKFTLTSVGMAIAHANVKRFVGAEFAPLSIWIN